MTDVQFIDIIEQNKKINNADKTCPYYGGKNQSINIFESKTNVNKLPTKSTPNSVAKKPNGDLRYYGPDGKAVKDVDSSHPEHHPDLPNPHQHDWKWNNDGIVTRGPAYDPNISKTIIGPVAIASGGYIIYRVIRLLPSLIPGIWWSIPLNIGAL